MYRIGQFSHITKVTVKALRFYEEEGLLEPEHVDPATGYRYYSTDQLPRAHKIVALRQCGFSIPDIRRILAGRDIERLFAARKRELERRAVETDQQLASICHYLQTLGEDPSARYEVVIKELPRVLVYSKRLTVSSYDDYFDVIPKIGEDVTRANPGIRCVTDPPYCYIAYLDGEFRERDINVEFCEAVTDWGNPTDGIVFKIVERVPRAACVLHKGPYSALRAAYSAVFRWIDDNGFVAAGNPRESYIDGIWSKPSEDDWLTELQVPLLDRAATTPGNLPDA